MEIYVKIKKKNLKWKNKFKHVQQFSESYINISSKATPLKQKQSELLYKTYNHNKKTLNQLAKQCTVVNISLQTGGLSFLQYLSENMNLNFFTHS